MIYNNYHKHDHVSNIFTPDVNVKPIDYINRIKELGHTTYFTTNHGSGGDIFESYKLCKENNIHCKFGVEGYIVPNPIEKDRRNYHIIIIPTTNKSRKKLNLATSRANIEGYYYKPRLFLEDLLAFDKDELYITNACVAGLFRDEDSIKLLANPLVEHFEDHFLLEVQMHDDTLQIEQNKFCLTLSQRFGLKLIAANDSHYIYPEQSKERDELLKGKGIVYSDEDSYLLDYPDYDTLFKRFQRQGLMADWQIEQAIKNTLIFDECEDIELDMDTVKMPTIYPNLTPDERIQELKKHVSKKFKEICREENITGEKYQEYKTGIREEMKVIEDTKEINTADYFLFNEKNTDLAVNKYGGVLTRTGRGSCGAFYINRILGMTQLDRFTSPIKLYPDRFMSTARLLENKALPDIDFNVVSDEPFVKASRELLGEHGCYPMIAYGTMKESESFRNVCRSNKLNYDEFNAVAKDLDSYREDEKWIPYIEEAQKYVGTIVSSSIHPCAFLLLDKDIRKEYGVVRCGDALCVMITSGEADLYKFLKNDYLKVLVWKLISETFELIGKPIMTVKQLTDSLDEDTYKILADGITCTLNQADSDFATGFMKTYKAKSIAEASTFTACLRPFFEPWRNDFVHRLPYTTGEEQIDALWEESGNYPAFQESLMSYFSFLGVTPAKSIGLIKKISKKKIKQKDFEDLEKTLKENWMSKIGNMDNFQNVWELVQSCMSYGFAAPHAEATGIDMLYGAYLKSHYPLEYYTVCFNNYSDDEVRTNKLTNELSYFGISLLNPRFRMSRSTYVIDKDSNSIYKGIASIKFLNSTVAEELYELRDKQFSTFVNLLIKLNDTSINSRQMEILTKINFFEEFGSPNTLLRITEIFNKLYGKKQIKKDKVADLKIDGEILINHASKVTEKTICGIDMLTVLREIADGISIKTPLKTYLTYENECLGYPVTTDSNIDRRLYFVRDINLTKWLANIDLYEVATGKTRRVKMWISSFNKDPFFKSNFLHISAIDKKNKKEPTGEINPDTGKKIYRDVPNDYEFWLKSYYIVNEV